MYCVWWYLLLRSFSMDHVCIDAFVNQLVEKLSCSLFGLYKYQHGRQKALKMTTGHISEAASFLLICNSRWCQYNII